MIQLVFCEFKNEETIRDPVRGRTGTSANVTIVGTLRQWHPAKWMFTKRSYTNIRIKKEGRKPEIEI